MYVFTKGRVLASGLGPLLVRRNSTLTKTEKYAASPVAKNAATQNSSGNLWRDGLFRPQYTSVLMFHCPHPHAWGVGCPGQPPRWCKTGSQEQVRGWMSRTAFDSQSGQPPYPWTSSHFLLLPMCSVPFFHLVAAPI